MLKINIYQFLMMFFGYETTHNYCKEFLESATIICVISDIGGRVKDTP